MKFTKYDAGTPCWADLMTNDIEKAKDFYSNVFGWEMYTNPEEAFGGYTTGQIDGETVCGLMSTQGPEQPNAWNVYLATDDIDQTLKQVSENGGNVVMDKMVVAEHGSMAVAQDPQGAFVSFWQAEKMIGSTIANEYNTICWDELATSDIEGAKKFYTALFGWTENEGSTDDYYQFDVSGAARGGVRPLSENEAGFMPSYWGVYFRVQSLADACAAIEKNGGEILTPVMNADKIEFQACKDSTGAYFAICQYEDEA